MAGQPGETGITESSAHEGDAGTKPDLVAAVLEHLGAAVQSLDPKKRGPQDNPGNRKLITTATRVQRATLDDWRTVIDAQLASVRHNPEAWRYLCLSTITRPRNWARIMDAPAARPSNRGAHVARGEYQDL